MILVNSQIDARAAGLKVSAFTLPRRAGVLVFPGIGAALLGNFGPYTRAIVNYTVKEPVVIRMRKET
jgi:hypothetical protein